MDIQRDLGALPPKSVYRKILLDLLHADEKVRDAGYRRLRDLDKPTTQQGAHATTWKSSDYFSSPPNEYFGHGTMNSAGARSNSSKSHCALM